MLGGDSLEVSLVLVSQTAANPFYGVVGDIERLGEAIVDSIGRAPIPLSLAFQFVDQVNAEDHSLHFNWDSRVVRLEVWMRLSSSALAFLFSGHYALPDFS
jgi:hypothetical protein